MRDTEPDGMERKLRAWMQNTDDWSANHSDRRIERCLDLCTENSDSERKEVHSSEPDRHLMKHAPDPAI